MQPVSSMMTFLHMKLQSIMMTGPEVETMKRYDIRQVCNMLNDFRWDVDFRFVILEELLTAIV